MANTEIILTNQAKAYTKYLLNVEPDENTLSQYIGAMKKTPELNDFDKHLLGLIDRHPWTLPSIDAVLPYVAPYSELRRRLYILFAILESNPTYTEYFLAQRRSPFYIIPIGFSLVASGLKALGGFVIIKIFIKGRA
jgi:hypothetical protein